jgi:hypothetical protein
MKTNFKVGDKVYCIIKGWGIITDILESCNLYIDFPIIVSIINDEGKKETASYTLDGRYLTYSQPTLSFTEYTLQGFSQERPIDIPEVGEEIMVSVNGKNWELKKFHSYHPERDYPVITVERIIHDESTIEFREENYKYLKRLK